MPYNEVMPKWKRGQLHSGSKSGPIVKSQKQAVAIMLSEKRAAEGGQKEYQPKKYQEGGPVDAAQPDRPITPTPQLDQPSRPITPTPTQMVSSSWGAGTPSSKNVEDRRKEPASAQYAPVDLGIAGRDIEVDEKNKIVKAYTSPQGKAYAAKHLPATLPTTPIAQKKGGPVTKDSGKGWRRW